MKIGIIGANGQLGTDLVRVFTDHEVLAWTRSDFDIRDPRLATHVITQARPDVVINTAAFHKTDACEDDIETAFSVNAIGARTVARAGAACGAAVVYVSTDYVFGGEKVTPYVEDDPPSPINACGVSKLAGERLTAAVARHYIVRVASLFGLAGASGKGGNFVETMLAKAGRGEALTVVNDITTSPTYTLDAAQLIRQLIEAAPPQGIYHIVNYGACTWFAFAAEILRQARLSADLKPTSAASMISRARRPLFSALASSQGPAAGRPLLRPWHAAPGG